jgi:L-cysteate sulfo-lyase
MMGRKRFATPAPFLYSNYNSNNMPPRLHLAHLPTPLEPLHRLTAHLGGPEIWVKRDDQTGLAGGGNKTRKLEYLLADAQSKNARVIITGGVAQSNHCRQTAAACARLGLRCILILRGQPPVQHTGNVLIDELLGASLIWTSGGNREAMMQAVYESELASGNDPYLIPIGGSNAIGACGYVTAAEELKQQLTFPSLPPSFDRIVFASSSGGTHAGLALGGKTFLPNTEIIGISIDAPETELQASVADIANATATLLELPHTFTPTDIAANANYLGEGYGIIGDLERNAIRLLATLEGILLDPVYTARAFAGLLDLIQHGKIAKTERILFWHTGGQPALFAYADKLFNK